MNAILLALMCATLSAAAPPAAPSPKGEAPWEKPAGIPAESDLFQDRLRAPQSHFLVDGMHAFLAGSEFYQAVGEATPFLWPAHPFLRLRPDRKWLSDSSRVVFQAGVGNEVGDPFLQEVKGPGVQDNRAPFTAGSVSWSPYQPLRLFAGLDQIDHFSQTTFPARLRMVGADRQEKLSWIGGNLPPQSQLELGGAWEGRGGSRLSMRYDQGWWWTTSPASGRSFPWEGANTDIVYSGGEDFELHVVDQEWHSPLDDSFFAAHWRRFEVGMGFLGSSPGGWGWRLELGYQRRVLESDSLFNALDNISYPWSFRYRQLWSPEEDHFLKLQTQGGLTLRDRLFVFQHGSEIRETLGIQQFGQGLKGYYRHPLTGFKPIEENFPEDSTWQATWLPGKHARGLSAGLDYRAGKPVFQAGLAGNFAMEWQVPLFRASNLLADSLLIVRAGELGASEHVLSNASGRVFAGGVKGPITWQLQGGLRGFFGADADAVEFRPSPWWAGAGLAGSLPSDLRAEADLHYVGPKEVRGWGPDFRIASHFENNFALIQSVWDGRLKVSISALHAFGEDIREHPNGNPLRFRLIAGAQGAF